MPHRFIFSLRYSNKVFWKILTVVMVQIVFMTLFRLNLYFLSVFHAVDGVSGTELFHAFVAGARFDVLVWGFILLPVTLFLVLQAVMEKWPRWMFAFYRLYIFVTWSLVCFLSIVDFYHFAHYGQRMRWNDYQAWSFESSVRLFEGLQESQAWTYLVLTVLFYGLGLWLQKSLRFGYWKDEFSHLKGTRPEIAGRLLGPVLLVALAARGTVEAHHLELQHSQVSSNAVVNEMALNAVWCFDK